MTGPNDTVEGEAPRDAADWFARLNSEAARGQDWVRFETWLASDPSHELDFRAIEALWLDLDAPATEAASAEIISFQLRPAKGKLGGVGPSGANPAFGQSPRVVWVGLAAASVALLAVVFASRTYFPRTSPVLTPLDVPPGETRTLSLSGGSATLEGGTRLELANTHEGQSVHLISGGAVFRLKHDPARRLTVLAGAQQITDIGTVFTTRLNANELQVSVIEGEVGVQPLAGPGQSVLVHAGQALVRRQGEASSQVLAVDLRPLRRPYQDKSLADVVADLNQFYSRPIRIDGTTTARVRFTGVLVLDSEEAVVRRLEAYLPVTARISADAVVLASR